MKILDDYWYQIKDAEVLVYKGKTPISAIVNYQGYTAEELEVFCKGLVDAHRTSDSRLMFRKWDMNRWIKNIRRVLKG